MNKSRFLWQSLMYANWAVIFFYWWSGSGILLTESLAGFFIALGRIAGLAAAYSILLQFFFMGRMPWLERVFGLDKLSRIHHSNGQRGLFYLVCHPLFLVLGYGLLTNTNFFSQFVLFITDFKHVGWAALGFSLFVIVVASSIYVVRKGLKYESWYFVHLMVYVAIFSSFWHQINVGEDILGQKIFYWYWISLYSIVFSSHLIFRFIRPVYNFSKFKFEVVKVQKETYNTNSVYITGRNIQNFKVQPGQFMIFRFLNRKMWWQAHPFSLSMLPRENMIRITVKELGDFTKLTGDITPGTKIIIDGPYGIFTDLFSVTPKTAFIAGGIGITPVRSLMEQMLAKHKDAILLYGNKTEQDIVFKNEFEEMKTKFGANISNILSDQPDFAGEKGKIDEEKIKRLIPDITSRDVYLCGPPPMMEGIIKILEKIGVPAPQIHYEKFSL